MRILPFAFLALTAASPQPFQHVIDEVSATMRDPASAQFRDIKQTGAAAYCGWVNGKNGFGGYTGFELFLDNGGKVEIIDADYLRLLEQTSVPGNAERLQQLAPCRA